MCLSMKHIFFALVRSFEEHDRITHSRNLLHRNLYLLYSEAHPKHHRHAQHLHSHSHGEESKTDDNATEHRVLYVLYVEQEQEL